MASLASVISSNPGHALSPNILAHDAKPRKICNSQCSTFLFPPHRSPICRMGFVCGLERKMSLKTRIFASVTDTPVNGSPEKVQLPKGDCWSVHKFGGTCEGNSERIKNFAQIILSGDSERKMVVVSAMSKVTDMMCDLIYKAQSRDEAYISALDAVLEKHKSTALDLLDGDDLSSFLAQLHHDISNLKAMLRAIYIAGHATESFADFVVGHGELWSAQMLSSVIRKNGVDCNWMDTREVLIVNPTSSNQVDPDLKESEDRLLASLLAHLKIFLPL